MNALLITVCLGVARALVPPMAAPGDLTKLHLKSGIATGAIMDAFEQRQLDAVKTKERPVFSAGDTINVAFEIIEGATTRVQNYAGVVIKRSGGGFTKTFTVRKMSYGIGVERTFPLYSPSLKDIEVLRRGSVRRSRLYYLRALTGKSARIAEKVRGLNYVMKQEAEIKAKAEEKIRLAEEAEAAAAAAAAAAEAAEEAEKAAAEKAAAEAEAAAEAAAAEAEAATAELEAEPEAAAEPDADAGDDA